MQKQFYYNLTRNIHLLQSSSQLLIAIIQKVLSKVNLKTEGSLKTNFSDEKN